MFSLSLIASSKLELKILQHKLYMRVASRVAERIETNLRELGDI